MLKWTKCMENHLFFGLPVYERRLPRKIGKQKVQVQSRYFHFAFERTISDVPFWTSSRHKMTTFDAYVTRWHTRRARVRNAMRSWFEYRWTRNREFIRNEQIFLRLTREHFQLSNRFFDKSYWVVDYRPCWFRIWAWELPLDLHMSVF